MESSQPQPKQKRGIKKLWAKIKAATRSKPTTSTNSTTTTTTNTINTLNTRSAPPEAHSTLPTPSEDPKRIASLSPVTTEPVQSPIIVPVPEKPTNMSTNMSEIIEVDDDEGEDEEYADTYHDATTTDLCSILNLPTSRSHLSPPLIRDPTMQRTDIARDIYKKYNINFDPAEFNIQSKPQTERVEKKPRMRVRWTCHVCNAIYGRDRNCPSCHHPRCQDCIRYPPKKPREKTKKKSAKTRPAVPVVEKPETGACHECKTRFEFSAAQCPNCSHQICERCLQETVQEAPITQQSVDIVS